MPGLEPGLYQVAAVRDGFARSTASVEVAAPETHRVDFLLAAEYPPAREAKPAPAAADPMVAAVEEELAALKKRIGELEVALQARAAHARADGRGRRTPQKSPRRLPPPPAAAPAPLPAPQPRGPAAILSGSPAVPGPGAHARQLHSVRVRRLYVAQRHVRATRTPCWTRSSSRRKSGSTLTS